MNNTIKTIFRPKIEPEVLKCYEDKLPGRIEVAVNVDSDGRYWAKIKLENDTLFTEADTRDKLEENVNKAVACYFEIKKEYIPYLLINKRYYDSTVKRKSALKTA